MGNKKVPLITVVIPVYKVEDYLEKCVKSVLNQTYKNLQIILVDDGSPDNSGKICDELSKIDDRIFVIHKENGGLSDARNFGILNAKGEFICFIDSDDYVDTDYIESMYKHIDPQCIVCCRYYRGNNLNFNRKEPLVLSANSAIDYYFTDQCQVLDGIAESYGSYAWNKLYPLSFFQNIKYPKGKIYEDMYVILWLYNKAQRVVFLPERKYHYIERQESIVKTSDITRGIIDGRSEQKRQLIDLGLWDAEKDKWEKIIVGAIYQRFIAIKITGDTTQDKKEILKEKAYADDLLKNLKIPMSRRFYIKRWIATYFPFLYTSIHSAYRLMKR